MFDRLCTLDHRLRHGERSLGVGRLTSTGKDLCGDKGALTLRLAGHPALP